MSKASVITLRVPHELKQRISTLADYQGVSVNQFAMYLLTNSVSQMENDYLIAARLGNQSVEEAIAKGLAVLDKVQDRSVPEWDQLPRAEG